MYFGEFLDDIKGIYVPNDSFSQIVYIIEIIILKRNLKAQILEVGIPVIREE